MFIEFTQAQPAADGQTVVPAGKVFVAVDQIESVLELNVKRAIPGVANIFGPLIAGLRTKSGGTIMVIHSYQETVDKIKACFTMEVPADG